MGRFRTHRISRLVSLCAVVLLGTCGCVSAASEGAGPRLRVTMLNPPRAGLMPYSDDAFALVRLGVTETLTTLDDAGNARSGLATSWVQSGPRAWRFALREDVRFHDGTPMAPTAVVRALTEGAKARPPVLDGVGIQAQASGKNEITVTTSHPDPLLPWRLSNPRLAIVSEGAHRRSGTVASGTGTGPFVLTGVDGNRAATLERFPDYWDGEAKAPGLDVSFTPDPAQRIAALRSGHTDVVEALPPAQLAGINPGNYLEVTMPRTTALYLNVRPGSPLRDPATRAAVRDSIELDPIIEGPYLDNAEEAYGLLPSSIPWTANRTGRALGEPGPVPPERLTLATASNRAELPETAAILEEQLESAGFVVDRVVDEQAAIEAGASAGRFDLVLLSRSMMRDSGSAVPEFYSDFACHGTENLSGLCDPAVDQALTAAANEPDIGLRQNKALTAERVILETETVLPLVHEVVIQGESPGTVHASFDPMERQLVRAKTHNKNH